MNHGCIATGEIKCGGCHGTIEHVAQYLVTEKKEGEKLCLCIDCCVSKGYATYIDEKGDQAVTFFPPPSDS